MGALLLAAEAATLAASCHGTEERRWEASRSSARGRTLVARCGGAKTPALQDIDTGSIFDGLTRRELDVAKLAARG